MRIPYIVFAVLFAVLGVTVIRSFSSFEVSEMATVVFPARAGVVEVVEEEKPPRTQEQIVKEICHSAYNDLYKKQMDGYNVGFDLYMDTCYRDLLAIATQETGRDCSKIGDSGNSYGCYQIHRGYHPEVSIEDATDFGFSTAWTLGRLVEYGWPHERSYAIMKHNGSNDMAKKYAEDVKALADTIKY